MLFYSIIDITMTDFQREIFGIARDTIQELQKQGKIELNEPRQI